MKLIKDIRYNQTMNIRPYVLFLLILSLNTLLGAQELNGQFLESLSDDVRNQLLNEINTEEESATNKNYRPPSTEISLGIPELRSEKFGVDFFRTLQTTFMPINEPIFDPDYILGYGDKIKLQFIGQKNNIIDLIVSRDGSINLPDLGKVVVAGLSLDSVDKLLQEKIKQSFIGTDVFITLDSIRDIQILVVGEAAYPGVYTVPGNASLLNILAAAGGFTDEASLRKLQIIRDSKPVSTVDLYKAFVYGDFSKINSPLRAGDTIFISPATFEVRIQGGVRRSAIFELVDGEGYKELLSFANGYINSAKTDQIQLSRVENQSIKNLVFKDDDLETFSLKHQDVITVQSIDALNVNISGSVKRPGNYFLPKGSSIIDLLNIAGGYTDDAYPFGGIYTTESSKQQELKAKALTRQNLLNFLSSNAVAEDNRFDIEMILSQFESLEPLGRVSINFSLNSLRSKKDELMLSDGDRIVIPPKTSFVHVYGDIENPGSFQFQTEKDFRFYLSLAGSLKETNSRKIILYHPNGESQIIESSFGFSLNSSRYFIYPGTLIYVPNNFKLSGLETTKVYLPIISNLALTMASVASLSNSTK